MKLLEKKTPLAYCFVASRKPPRNIPVLFSRSFAGQAFAVPLFPCQIRHDMFTLPRDSLEGFFATFPTRSRSIPPVNPRTHTSTMLAPPFVSRLRAQYNFYFSSNVHIQGMISLAIQAHGASPFLSSTHTFLSFHSVIGTCSSSLSFNRQIATRIARTAYVCSCFQRGNAKRKNHMPFPPFVSFRRIAQQSGANHEQIIWSGALSSVPSSLTLSLSRNHRRNDNAHLRVRGMCVNVRVCASIKRHRYYNSYVIFVARGVRLANGDTLAPDFSLCLRSLS